MKDVERLRHMIADRECEINAVQTLITQSDQINRDRVNEIIQMRREIDKLYDHLRYIKSVQMKKTA